MTMSPRGGALLPGKSDAGVADGLSELSFRRGESREPMTRSAYARFLGQRIRRQRRALRLTQSQVATHLGVSDSSLSGWERGCVVMDVYSYGQLKAFFKRQMSTRLRHSVGELAREAIDSEWSGGES